MRAAILADSLNEEFEKFSHFLIATKGKCQGLSQGPADASALFWASGLKGPAAKSADPFHSHGQVSALIVG